MIIGKVTIWDLGVMAQVGMESRYFPFDGDLCEAVFSAAYSEARDWMGELDVVEILNWHGETAGEC